VEGEDGKEVGESNYRRRTSFGVPPSLLCEKTGTDLNLYYLASPLNTFLAKEISIYLRKPQRRARKMNAPAANLDNARGSAILQERHAFGKGAIKWKSRVTDREERRKRPVSFLLR